MKANEALTSLARVWTEPLGLILWKLWSSEFYTELLFLYRKAAHIGALMKNRNQLYWFVQLLFYITCWVKNVILCAMAREQVTSLNFGFTKNLEKIRTSWINMISFFKIINCSYLNHGYVAVNIYACSLLQQNSCSSNHKLLFSGVVKTRQQKTRDWSMGSDDQFIQD